MAIRTTDDINKTFPLTGDTGRDEITLAFRALAAKIIERAPSSHRRDSLVGAIGTTYRQLGGVMSEPETGKDKDLAAAKLAEIFPDGDAPGADDPDPVVRMANALAAMKAAKVAPVEPIVEQPIEEPK